MSADPSHVAYRPDIEGLRGIAVLSVFAVHSVPDALRGGFIGVDVFFVLSGYLIASITLRELDAGTFSVAGFYRRRIRRLLPALLVVLAACLLFAALLAIPADAKAIGKHVLAGAAFVSNLVLWSEAGYFDPSSDFKPLLHLWSLGIEEQFYLLWPLLVLLLAWARRWSIAVIALALTLSFALNVAFVADKPKAVFFLPPTRFWEMLVGALLATWSHRVVGGPVASARQMLAVTSTWHARVPDSMAAAGVALLVVALVVINKTDHFPGWWALLPTLGTFLILSAGMQAWLNRAVLAQPVLMFYGRISYPLYLWHWPLLTFPVLLSIRMDWWGQIGLLGVAVGLAVLTTRFVEHPFRAGRPAPAATRWLLAGLGAAGVLGAALHVSDGLLNLYPQRVRAIAQEHLRQDPETIRMGRCFQTTAQARRHYADECIDKDPSGLPLLVLWGDSFAASFYPGLRHLADSGALAARIGQFTGPLCPPLLEASDHQLHGCDDMNRVAIDQISRHRPDTVVLMGAWLQYHGSKGEHAEALDGLRETIRLLRDRGVARIVVVGSLPVWREAQPRTLMAAWRDRRDLPARVADGLAPGLPQAERRIESIARASGAEFLSPLRALCNIDGCEATVERDGVLHPIAHDEAHLTVEGSRRLARTLLDSLRPDAITQSR